MLSAMKNVLKGRHSRRQSEGTMEASSSSSASDEDSSTAKQAADFSFTPLEGLVRQVVVAVNGDDSSRTVVEWAVKHICRPGDILCLLYVEPRVEAKCYQGGRSSGRSSGRTSGRRSGRRSLDIGTLPSRASVEELMRSLSGAAARQYLVHPEIVIREGVPEDVIVEEAHRRNAITLVLGSRDYQDDGASKRTRGSSVSDLCRQRCQVPIVMVQARHGTCGGRRSSVTLESLYCGGKQCPTSASKYQDVFAGFNATQQIGTCSRGTAESSMKAPAVAVF